jgi:hypothetical protein
MVNCYCYDYNLSGCIIELPLSLEECESALLITRTVRIAIFS